MATDIRYVDYRRVKRFLEENGFSQMSVQPSLTTGQSIQGSDAYVHNDGRGVVIGKKDDDGIPRITSLHLEDGTNRTIQAPRQAFTTVEDLSNFVNYGRISNPADRGQKNLNANTAIIRLGYRFLNIEKSVPAGIHIDGPQAQQYAGQQSMQGEEGGPGSGRRPYGYARQKPRIATVPSVTVPRTTMIGTTVPYFEDSDMNPNQQRRGPGSGPVGTVAGGSVRFDDQTALGASAMGGEYGHTAGGDSRMETTDPTSPKQMMACPMTKQDEEAGTKHNPTDCHTRLSVSMGNRPLPEGQQKLQNAGYVMDSAQGELGSTLDYKYRHPDGHEITLSSADGQNVTGMKYQFKPPKPQMQGVGQPQDMPRPPIGNIFAQNANQRPPSQQPQQASGKPGLGIFRPPANQTPRPQIGPQPGGNPKGEAPNTFAPGSTQPNLGPQAPKQEMRGYAGGQAPVTGQGRKQVVNVSVAKGVPMGPFEQMGGPGIFCDMCHVAVSTWVPYKGMRLCRSKCWAKVRPVGTFVRK